MSKQGLQRSAAAPSLPPRSCYMMTAQAAINFIDHNFLRVSPIMARVAWAYLRFFGFFFFCLIVSSQ